MTELLNKFNVPGDVVLPQEFSSTGSGDGTYSETWKTQATKEINQEVLRDDLAARVAERYSADLQALSRCTNAREAGSCWASK